MEPDDSSSDVLSQSEVERLLAQVAEQDGSLVIYGADGSRKRLTREAVQPYDFRHPVFLSANELRKLRLRHEEFIRALAARMSIHLRLEFGLQMAKLHTITYQKLIESLPNPTHLTLFKVEPLRGICILDINPRLGLTMVERLMGGPGHSVAITRDLSEIEVALLDQIVQVILNEWCNHWASLKELRLTLLGHESNGRFLQTAPHDTVMLGLTMEARLGDCMEQMQIGFPYYTLEPLVRQLGEEIDAEARSQNSCAAGSLKWNRDLDRVSVPVTAGWDNLEIPARELAALKPGDVLQLAPDCANQVRVRLAKTNKFAGTLGTRGKWWAVAINQVLKP